MTIVDTAIDTAIDGALGAIRTELAGLVTEIPAGAERETASEIASYITALVPAAQGAVTRAAAHRENRDIHPDGRAARAEAELLTTGAAIEETRRRLEPMITVVEAQLTVRALPQPTGQERETATAEASAVLSASANKAHALERLGKDDDPAIRSLVAGPWGARMAEAHGIAPEALTAARAHALEREGQGAGARAGYARAAARTGLLRSTLGGASSLARSVLGGAGL